MPDVTGWTVTAVTTVSVTSLPKIVIPKAPGTSQRLTAQAKVKIYVSGGRHSINLPSELVRDSAFPFKPLEELVARIDGKRVVIEKA